MDHLRMWYFDPADQEMAGPVILSPRNVFAMWREEDDKTTIVSVNGHQICVRNTMGEVKSHLRRMMMGD